ncbi:putative ferulic acid esterase protein [Phaeoacremonium minimum UCRPA7]|uniref:feruloyl esterase n=1 Tax=Phaeoacremonium minimum (strain UCR-PA7) TaxID=1286976 RepID=R8BE59_PHAM7|nr:putative ferulic acid esterase protein [Phaeoacremonium minimum UCRPA7]EON97591.1 putative ferulic acid esterase protein [Phaeoacremonium minimum UCRPA7]
MVLIIALLYLLAWGSVARAAPLDAQTSIYAEGDTSGCGQDHLFNGITKYYSIQSGGRARTYSVHAPSSYSKSTKYPLIVGFHGSDSIGLFFEADTRLDEPQYTANKIMVYPDGVDGAWAGASYSTVAVAEDVQFVHDLLADVRQRYCIDSARIYATGMSNGAGFIGALACNDTVGGEFAAYAPVAGAFYTDANGTGCTPARSPLPIMEFHGGSDASVLYDGGQGEGGYEPPIPTWLGYWADRNGCQSPPSNDSSFNDDVHHLTWTCQGLYGALQHYKVDDMKHQWPSEDINFSQIAAGGLPTHIEASSIIQTFFDNFTRPA